MAGKKRVGTQRNTGDMGVGRTQNVQKNVWFKKEDMSKSIKC